jgi:hypothetical protein
MRRRWRRRKSGTGIMGWMGRFGKRKRLLFLKKKKQKDFHSVVSARPQYQDRAETRE